MKLKDEPSSVYKGVSDQDIKESLDVVNQILHADVKVDMSTAELRKVKELQTFLAEHGKSSHYVFQLKKCNSCTYCTVINPPRIPADEFDELHFLPDPVPGENDHYLSFKEVYRRNTREEHRPGALAQPEENANDKRHRELFKNGKVREVIMCGECLKPRCIYSERKLTREQEELLLRLRKERFYTCGDPLVQDDTEEIQFVVMGRHQLCDTNRNLLFLSFTETISPTCLYSLWEYRRSSR